MRCTPWLLYVLLVLDVSNLPGKDLIFTIAIATVFVSVFARGLTAFPGANGYADRMETQRDRRLPELKSVKMIPVRLPWKS